MTYFSQIATVAAIHLLALVSPGPDFILVTQNSLMHSKRSGMYTAAGLALGTLIHITYSLIGIGFIIAQSIVLFSLMKFLGAGYLAFIGWKAVRSSGPAKIPAETDEALAESSIGRDFIDLQKEKQRALRAGFLTNITNPKVTLFFLSVFTLVISPATPFGIKLLMAGEMITAQFLWFLFVAVIVSHRAVKKRFAKIQHYAEKVMGALLIALGVKLALSSSK